MNANTALKINDAVDQAVRCGESDSGIMGQVNRALAAARRAETIRRAMQAEQARKEAEAHPPILAYWNPEAKAYEV